MNTMVSPWIRNASFDVSLVFGGAIFTLAIAAAAMVQPALLPLFFWIWVVGFEGSHFWATFSRTYIDTKFRAENRASLIGSLIFFLLPLAAVLHDEVRSTVSMMTLYGFFIFVWSLYHNARQHYGFLSIYSKKAGFDEEQKSKYVTLLYMGTCAAQIYFLFNFKALSVFELSASGRQANLNFVLTTIPQLVSLAAFVGLAWVAFKTYSSRGARSLVPAFYVGTCLCFYSAMFYTLAPMDHFVQKPNGAETLILITIMNSLFHNIQYHAIVWHYGQARFTQDQSETSSGFGIAKKVNGNTVNYLGVALAMGAVFGFIMWNLADWPNAMGSFSNSTPQKWAYVLFFGIIGHHFYLDQKIWRPSRQTELRSYLKLSA